MHTINQDDILHFLTSNQPLIAACNHSAYLEWHHGNPELTAKLTLIGQLVLELESWENKEYWGQDAPIVFGVYPYVDCKISQCGSCKNVFFHYTELGGHAAQQRYRLIRKELIDVTSVRPKYRIVVDYVQNEYVVHKNPDLSYEVSISKQLGLGVDILHRLTADEETAYLKFGIAALANRMEDMDRHYNNYNVVSWR